MNKIHLYIAKLYTEKCLPEVLEVGKCRSRVSDKDYTATWSGIVQNGNFNSSVFGWKIYKSK